MCFRDHHEPKSFSQSDTLCTCASVPCRTPGHHVSRFYSTMQARTHWPSDHVQSSGSRSQSRRCWPQKSYPSAWPERCCQHMAWRCFCSFLARGCLKPQGWPAQALCQPLTSLTPAMSEWSGTKGPNDWPKIQNSNLVELMDLGLYGYVAMTMTYVHCPWVHDYMLQCPMTHDFDSMLINGI